MILRRVRYPAAGLRVFIKTNMKESRRMIDRSLNYGRKQIKKFLLRIPDVRHSLDLGAGRGDDLALVRAVFPEADCHAVECRQEAALALAREGIDAAMLDIERERLPWADNSMDLVIINQVLEHVKDHFWLLHETSRVLGPGGYLIVGVPNLASLHNRILLFFGRQPTPIANTSAHIRGWTTGDLGRFLAIGGCYKKVGRRGANFYPFPALLARPLAWLFPGLAWGSMTLWQKRPDAEYGDAFVRFPAEHRLETNFYTGGEV